jgi:hypothetical protein
VLGRTRIRKAVIALIILIGAALAVRHALSRAPERSTPASEDGVQEIE